VAVCPNLRKPPRSWGARRDLLTPLFGAIFNGVSVGAPLKCSSLKPSHAEIRLILVPQRIKILKPDTKGYRVVFEQRWNRAIDLLDYLLILERPTHNSEEIIFRSWKQALKTSGKWFEFDCVHGITSNTNVVLLNEFYGRRLSKVCVMHGNDELFRRFCCQLDDLEVNRLWDRRCDVGKPHIWALIHSELFLDCIYAVSRCPRLLLSNTKLAKGFGCSVRSASVFCFRLLIRLCRLFGHFAELPRNNVGGYTSDQQYSKSKQDHASILELKFAPFCSLIAFTVGLMTSYGLGIRRVFLLGAANGTIRPISGLRYATLAFVVMYQLLRLLLFSVTRKCALR
jgi:hypothetical protein